MKSFFFPHGRILLVLARPVLPFSTDHTAVPRLSLAFSLQKHPPNKSGILSASL